MLKWISTVKFKRVYSVATLSATVIVAIIAILTWYASSRPSLSYTTNLASEFKQGDITERLYTLIVTNSGNTELEEVDSGIDVRFGTLNSLRTTNALSLIDEKLPGTLKITEDLKEVKAAVRIERLNHRDPSVKIAFKTKGLVFDHHPTFSVRAKGVVGKLTASNFTDPLRSELNYDSWLFPTQIGCLLCFSLLIFGMLFRIQFLERTSSQFAVNAWNARIEALETRLNNLELIAPKPRKRSNPDGPETNT